LAAGYVFSSKAVDGVPSLSLAWPDPQTILRTTAMMCDEQDGGAGGGLSNMACGGGAKLSGCDRAFKACLGTGVVVAARRPG
jgi:hypothetical protein